MEKKKISYWKYVKPHLIYFILGPIFMIMEILGEVVLPAWMANIINIGAANHDVTYIWHTGVNMIVFAFIMMFGGIGGAWFAVNASLHFGEDLRKDIFGKIQTFSFANLDKFSTGSLVTRLTNDITQIQNMITMLLRMMLRAPGMMIGAIIMSFTINRRLAMILLVVMPVLMAGIAILIKVGFPRFMKLQEKVDALNNNVRENLTNVRVIKSFVREKDENKKFAAANEDLANTGISALRVLVITWPFFSLIMDATVLLVVWLGGQQIIAGDMEVGSLTAFISYIFQVLFSLMMLAMILLQVPRASASSKRIKEVLGTDVDLNDIYAKHKDAEVSKGGITFKDVSFRYYKDSPESVLAHIDLEIKPGETLGIIGPTGCGKTTLVSLIPRLYDVDEGQVLVDGIDVRDYSLKNLREGVGMVLQKNVLFSGTIAENLKWGDPEADMSVIEEFADKAQADAFVKDFTDGYETILGQGGVNVSGGQKQRLCIARALLKKPKILILADSTSAVDTATERKIREAFNTTLQDTTTIIIAQRISSVMDADKIVVMEDGVITGVGTHDELLKSNVLYQEIFDSQMDNAKEVG